MLATALKTSPKPLPFCPLRPRRHAAPLARPRALPERARFTIAAALTVAAGFACAGGLAAGLRP